MLVFFSIFGWMIYFICSCLPRSMVDRIVKQRMLHFFFTVHRTQRMSTFSSCFVCILVSFIYLCDTSYTHAFGSFGSVTSTVTLSMTGTGLVIMCVCFLFSVWLPVFVLTLVLLAAPTIDAVAVQLLRFDRFETADALLLPREPRREPINTTRGILSICGYVFHIGAGRRRAFILLVSIV